MTDLDDDHLRAEADRELHRLGATDEEIAAARAVRAIGLLAAEKAALPGEPTYRSGELAARVRIDEELSRRLWRAMGFPDAGEDDVVFTEADAEALSTVHAMLAAGITTVDEVVQMTRTIGSSMARIAEAMVTAGPTEALEQPPDAGAEYDDQDLFALGIAPALETQSKLLVYVWRRHMQAVIRRRLLARLAADEYGSSHAVGFADLVGFTSMSQQLEPAQLASVVSRFEELAFDQVANHGGRIAKMIGDEVMFVVRDPAEAVETGLALAEAYADDEVLSDVRVGIAFGDVLVHEGDYFGPVVNLASRIVGIALPGSVVVSPSVYEATSSEERFVFHHLRPRQLKDIGRVRLWRVRHAHPSTA